MAINRATETPLKRELEQLRQANAVLRQAVQDAVLYWRYPKGGGEFIESLSILVSTWSSEEKTLPRGKARDAERIGSWTAVFPALVNRVAELDRKATEQKPAEKPTKTEQA